MLERLSKRVQLAPRQLAAGAPRVHAGPPQYALRQQPVEHARKEALAGARAQLRRAPRKQRPRLRTAHVGQQVQRQRTTRAASQRAGKLHRRDAAHAVVGEQRLALLAPERAAGEGLLQRERAVHAHALEPLERAHVAPERRKRRLRLMYAMPQRAQQAQRVQRLRLPVRGRSGLRAPAAGQHHPARVHLAPVRKAHPPARAQGRCLHRRRRAFGRRAPLAHAQPERVQYRGRLPAQGVHPPVVLLAGHNAHAPELLQQPLRRPAPEHGQGALGVMAEVALISQAHIEQIAAAVAGGQELATHAVALLQQQRARSARGQVRRRHQPRRAAADYAYVPSGHSPFSSRSAHLPRFKRSMRSMPRPSRYRTAVS